MQIWSNSSLRTSLLYTGTFLLVLLAAGTVTYDSIQEELSRRLEVRVLERFQQFENAFQQGGKNSLVNLVNTQAVIAKTSQTDAQFSLRGHKGQLIAGVDDFKKQPQGITTIQISKPLDKEHATFRLLTKPLGDMTLSVGLSLHDMEEVSEVMFQNFAWAALGVILLCSGGAYLISQEMQQRYNSMRNALERVASGHWSERLPMTAYQDDLDEFSVSINSTLDRLQNLMEAMRQVSADIAHDLKTPIGHLYIAAEEALELLAKGGNPLNELEAIRDEANTINSTFEALLSISHIEGGARQDRFKSIDLTSLLENIIEPYEAVAADSGWTLTFNSELSEPAHILGDKDLLMRLIANLIENALRHCPKGTAISIGLILGEGGTICLTINDNGPGIPAHERENVLRRLYRLEKSRTTPGSGLGLALVKAIADLHNAQLSLSDNNPGLKVTIEFPSIKLKAENNA
ncbi:MAG: ATP-binding protein [Rhodomicrobiaceae bacterium]